MTIQKFFYLINPIWLVYFFSAVSFGINIVLTTLVAHKWLRHTAFRTRKVISAISFIAAGFVLIPFLVFENFDFFDNANSNIFTKAYSEYSEFLVKIFENLFGVLSYEHNELTVIFLGCVYLFLLFAPFLVAAVGLLLILLRKSTLKQKLFILFLTALLGLMSTIFIATLSFFSNGAMDDYNQACHEKVYAIDEFYLHVEDLCNNRPTLDECPKYEEDVRAFNTEKYDAMQSCTDSIYYFREDYGQAWFIRKNWWESTPVSRHKNFPGDLTKYRYSRSELMKVKHTYYDRF
jgi:hypothetical protein